jgi:hypothetical protein
MDTPSGHAQPWGTQENKEGNDGFKEKGVVQRRAKLPGRLCNATIAKARTEKKACNVQCCAGSPQKTRGRPCKRSPAQPGQPLLIGSPSSKKPRTVEAVLDGASSTFSGNRRVQTKKPPAPTSIGLGETPRLKALKESDGHLKSCIGFRRPPSTREADKSNMDIARPPPQRLDLFDKGGSAIFSGTQGRPKLPGRPCNRSLVQARQLLLTGSPVLPKAVGQGCHV